MQLSSILFLFLTHLGIGITATLLLVAREAGVKFFRFNTGLALTLLVIGIAFRPKAPVPSAMSTVAVGALVTACAALFVYYATVGRTLRRIRPVLLPIATVAGAAALTLQALDVSASFDTTTRALTVASFVTSAGLLGGACTSMILGHWYLVLPSMDVSHLQSIVKFHIGSLVARIALVALAVAFAIATWQPGTLDLQRYILSTGGIFFWQRVLFGLFGPALLGYLTWETAKIRSTQSATGILYVDFFTVVVGEVLAKYLLLSTSVPV